MTKLEQAALQTLEALIVAEEFVNRHSEDWYISGQKDLKQIREAITSLREALADPQITTPDVCGEVCARAKLCYGCNKDLEEANAKFAEQTEQEPMAWMVTMENQNGTRKTFPLSWRYKDVRDTCDFGDPIPLYASPVRTKDLTDDEIDAFIDRAWDKQMSMPEIIRAVIAADREKNK